ncbi:hypothetical protein M7I_2726 [Glarea lozoyensis 74030]|uniref:Uncharacterized protein n=1 Tax=Glarea lozoyensis (strain ATCC 74030 / MF5533) TaxID=1104152 RepID=H0EJJ9_GLAL7|nr:hypothetical protein M7I_2726 [Glarea lozoyensis 74030]
MSQALIRRPWQAILAAILLFFLVLLISKSHVHSGIPSTLGFSQSGLSSPVAINQTLGIFVVSLPERTDRRDSMILATALSDIKFDFIDAIHGDQVPDRAIPFGTGRSAAGGDSNIGSWRAHMNAIKM